MMRTRKLTFPVRAYPDAWEDWVLTWDPTDLREQYEVRLEEGLDAFVVIDGLPIVPEDSKQKLVKFLLRKLNTVGKTKEESIFMPLNDKKMSEG